MGQTIKKFNKNNNIKLQTSCQRMVNLELTVKEFFTQIQHTIQKTAEISLR